jgi:hypothetical protein
VKYVIILNTVVKYVYKKIEDSIKIVDHVYNNLLILNKKIMIVVGLLNMNLRKK